MHRTPLAIVVTCALLCMALPVRAQDYPQKALRFIAPNPPGGPTDLLARLLGQKLADAFGQPVVVENRAGAGGNIGTEAAARSAPDGYTLLTGNNATFGANVSLYRRPGFDPLKDFAPIVFVATQPNILVVHPSLPVHSVKQLIALGRGRPGQLNYASSGAGTVAHLGAELFKSMAGIDMLHIAYKGGGPALTDLVGGQTQLMFATALSAYPHVQSKRLRAIAVTNAQRARAYPDLPTVAESGLPGYEATTWHGVLTVAGTPQAIVTRLNSELNRALQSADVRDKLNSMGAEIVGGSVREFAEHIRREIPKWAKIVQSIGLRLD